MITPTTRSGRWSALAAASFALCFAAFAALVAAGQRGGEEFFDNLWLAVPFLAAYLSAVAAFVLGAGAILRAGDRSVTVIVITVLGLLVTTFGVLEVIFPH